VKKEFKELAFIDLAVIQEVESLAPKPLYEIVKSKPAIVADKNLPYVTSDEEYSLGEYSDKQREYWKTSKNIPL
jgi:hypothetical protein